MPASSGAREGSASARWVTPGLALLAVVGGALIVGYLGNAAWNLIHLGQGGGATQLLAAATLPAPLARGTIPLWVELASAGAFVLVVLLVVVTLCAIGVRRSRPTAPPGEADPVLVFIADKTRNVSRPALTAPPAPANPPAPETPQTPKDS